MELKASNEWELLMEYVVFAAGKATGMPVWNNEGNNKSRVATIKKFIGLGNTVVKKLKKDKSADFWKPHKETYVISSQRT